MPIKYIEDNSKNVLIINLQDDRKQEITVQQGKNFTNDPRIVFIKLCIDKLNKDEGFSQTLKTLISKPADDAEQRQKELKKLYLLAHPDKNKNLTTDLANELFALVQGFITYYCYKLDLELPKDSMSESTYGIKHTFIPNRSDLIAVFCFLTGVELSNSMLHHKSKSERAEEERTNRMFADLLSEPAKQPAVTFAATSAATPAPAANPEVARLREDVNRLRVEFDKAKAALEQAEAKLKAAQAAAPGSKFTPS